MGDAVQRFQNAQLSTKRGALAAQKDRSGLSGHHKGITMTDSAEFRDLSFPLFVPGDRPERIAKACAAGTDCVIVDLEDAVAAQNKVAVRGLLQGALPVNPAVQVYVRINGTETVWYEDDVACAGALGFDGVILPKAQSAEQIAALRAKVPAQCLVVALVESVSGLAHVNDIARAADRIAFGSIDFAQDMGCAHTQAVLLPARHALVMAARLANRPPPIDGVTTAIRDEGLVAADSAHGRDMGFAGKLLIHPAQIAPARAAYRPSAEDVAWARRVIAASREGGASTVDGAMVDAPVVLRANRILARETSMQ